MNGIAAFIEALPPDEPAGGVNDPDIEETPFDAPEDDIVARLSGCPCCRLLGGPVAAGFRAQPVPSDLLAPSDERP